MASSCPAVGIDLGTSHSTVAYLDFNQRPETLRSAEGGLTTPSAVFLDRSGPLVGSEAQEAGRDDPERMVQLGRRDIEANRNHSPHHSQLIPPEVCQALVLRKLKADAEPILGKLDTAVLTVPASFTEPRRSATKLAGRLAGLETVELINEPMAAALCYGFHKHLRSTNERDQQTERVLIYDLGGGKFDASIVEIRGNEYSTIATGGDAQLGGIDWDSRIADYLAEQWIAKFGTDPRTEPVPAEALFRKATQAKHALSQRHSVEIPFTLHGQRIQPELTRLRLQKITKDLVTRTMTIAQDILDEAMVEWSDLNRVIMIGGSTRMPIIGERLSQWSGIECDDSLPRDEAVAQGAAIYAAICFQPEGNGFSEYSVKDVNSFDLSVLAKNTKSGHSQRQVIIPRSTTLPASRSVRFRTDQDHQTNLKVEIIEGGNDQGQNAIRIGKGIVEDLPKDIPKGTTVDLRFNYARDGGLNFSAKLPGLNQPVKTRLVPANGMSDETFRRWKLKINAGEIQQPDGTNIESATPDKPPHSIVKPAPIPASTPSANAPNRKASKPKYHPETPGTKPLPGIERKLQRVTAKREIVTDTSKPKSIKKLVRQSDKSKIAKPPGDWTNRREPFGKGEQDGA